MTKPKKPMSEAQRKQRLLYGATTFSKKSERRVSELDALRRAAGKGFVR